MMGGDTEAAIRERAYLIWEAEGRPEGRADDHWYMAMQEMFALAPVGIDAMPSLATEAAPARAKAPSAKKAGNGGAVARPKATRAAARPKA